MNTKVIPLKRGFTEIKSLFKILNEIGDVYIMGGYARYCASPKNEPYKSTDVDLFSKTEDKYNQLRHRLIDVEGLTIKCENDNAISLNIPESGILSACAPIQIIKPRVIARMVTVGSVEEILSNFDFTITRACILDEENVIVDENFIEDEKKGVLRLGNIHCPVSSTLRCVKYCKKGYKLPLDQALKLFQDWDERNADYKAKIKEYTEKSTSYKENVNKLKRKGFNDDEIKIKIEEEGLGLSQEEIEHMEELMLID